MSRRVLSRRFLLFFLIFISLSPSSLWAQDVPKYGVFELTLTATGNYPNPYLEMPNDTTTPAFVVGTFTGPNGETIKIDGYWDGGQTWKIRIAPSSIGTWSYATSSTDAGLNSKTGSFNCIASSSHGFLRIHPNNPHAFAYDDGTPYFWMGDTQVIFYHHNRDDYRFDNGNFQALQDLRASQGITSLYFGSWLFKKKGNFSKNEGGYNFENNDPDKLNPSFWQWADKRVEYVISKGIVPGFGIGWPDQGIGSFGKERLMRAWRYLIARYAAYNVMWILFGEADEFGINWQGETRYFGNAVKKFDPYNHIVATHVTGRSAPYLGDDAWLDINTEQISGWDFIIRDRLKGKPVVNLEFGYEGRISADELRKRAWGIVSHGGYFQYGDNFTANTPGRTYCMHLAKFFTQKTTYWLLQPHNEFVKNGNAYCSAVPGDEYVLYLPSGGQVTLELSAAKGTLSVEWYDPRKGETTKTDSISGGVSQVFSAPDTNDWVVHIRRTAGDQLSPPAAPTALMVIMTK